jgi:hypothetical protein
VCGPLTLLMRMQSYCESLIWTLALTSHGAKSAVPVWVQVISNAVSQLKRYGSLAADGSPDNFTTSPTLARRTPCRVMSTLFGLADGQWLTAAVAVAARPGVPAATRSRNQVAAPGATVGLEEPRRPGIEITDQRAEGGDQRAVGPRARPGGGDTWLTKKGEAGTSPRSGRGASWIMRGRVRLRRCQRPRRWSAPGGSWPGRPGRPRPGCRGTSAASAGCHNLAKELDAKTLACPNGWLGLGQVGGSTLWCRKSQGRRDCPIAHERSPS